MLGSFGFGGRGIGRPTVLGAGGAVLPPAQPDLLWHLDFTDLSTLWQDTGGTTPVTSDDDPIARADNKGSAGGHIQQNTATAEPLYDALVGGSRHQRALDFFDVQNFGTDLSAGNYSVAICWEHAVNALSATYIIGLGGLDTWIQIGTTGVVNFRISNTFMGQLTDNNDGEIQAYWATDDGANAQAVRYSKNTADWTAAATSVGPATTDDWHVGGNNGSGSTAFDGLLKEVLVYGKGLSVAERAEVQTYFTDRHGVVWS